MITPVERIFARSPFSIVTLVARINGEVSENMLRHAVSVQRRHPHLRARIEEDKHHNPWLTSEGVKEIPIAVIPRTSERHWMDVFREACQRPFEFEEQPAIRFILVQSSRTSELIILCHHIICDGLSLAYLARDVMVHLGEPNREVDILPDPVPIDTDNIPQEVSLNPLIRFLIHRLNRKWGKDRIYFDQEDYRNLNDAYWMNFTHRMLSIELYEAQTSAFVERCRKEHVTVNTALTTAFVGAQYIVQGEQPYHSQIAVAGSLRDRLPKPAGEAMGFYAGAVTLKYRYKRAKGFWDNARRLHRNVMPRYTNKYLFKAPLLWCDLAPTILEAFHFKELGGLVPSHCSRYHEISTFSKHNDVVLSLHKRRKMDSLDNIVMGTAVTNLTRLDFLRTYGKLEPDRLIMNSGGAFPLANVNVVIGAVTCAGKLSVVVEYAEETIETKTVEHIKDTAMEFLLT